MAVKIDLGQLREGNQQLDIITNSKELGLDEKLIKGKLDVAVDIFKAPNQLDLSVNVTGLLRLACDRCLEEFEQRFESEFELVYVQKPAEGVNLQDDYIKVYNAFTKSIDITEDLKEYVLLAIPMRKVPAEINDKCSWCGRSNEMWNSDILDLDKDNSRNT
jgi:DUF177 domain-containing protein